MLSAVSRMSRGRPSAATSAIGNSFRFGLGRVGVPAARTFVTGANKGLRIGRIDKPSLDPLVPQRMGEQIPGAVV